MSAVPRRPAVSVLLPVRDEEPFLADALDSVTAQSYEDFEALVVDDGSVDASARIAEAHAARDGRFRVLRQPRSGIVAALERARREARGRYLARMDGDDLALSTRLAAQVEAIEEDGLAACGVQVEYFPHRAVRDGARRYERWLNGLTTCEAAARDVFVECPLAHPALMARADEIERAGGWRARGWPEDYDLVLRLWRRGGRFRNVAPVGLRWREHGDRVSRTDPVYAQERFVRCKVHHLRRSLLGGRDVSIWGAGPVGKSFARELSRSGTSVACFVDVDPRKIGRTIAGAPVVSPGDAGRFPGTFALGAVAGPDARARIRAEILAQGRRDGIDFVAVA